MKRVGVVMMVGIWGATCAAVERPMLVLSVGEQRVLEAPGLVRYSLGSGILRARSTRDSVLLKAVQPGVSDLWVWNSNGEPVHRTIQVEKELHRELKPGLERALGALNEVEVLYRGGAGGVTLRGEIRTEAEAARVQALEPEITNQTWLSEELLTRGQAKLEAWLKVSPLASTLRIERREAELWVRGNLERAEEYPGLVRKIRGVFPATQIEIETLPDSAPTVHFRVFLLELRKNRFNSIGLSWPKSVEGAFHITPQKIWDTLQFDLALQALAGDGSARVLSNPELVVRAPGEAELFAGGELPIETHTKYESNVTWKNFGLTLKLKVTHTTGDRVRLEITTEVSHLDNTIAINKIPGVQANRMKTQVDARYGVPLLLSGLLQDDLREQAQGLPGLREIPVLGALFGSSDYMNERSELVAVLLPTSAPPPARIDRFEAQLGRHPELGEPTAAIGEPAAKPESAAHDPRPSRSGGATFTSVGWRRR